MTEQNWLAERFEAQRPQLRELALRMLGSRTEADDAVQEVWLKVSQSDTADVANLSGWLTTVTSRLCLDLLRSRKALREDDELDDDAVSDVGDERGLEPERERLMADALGAALLVVLDRLSPAERLAFVLHDTFGLSFDEIAPVIGRSAVATRKLASRARARVQGPATQLDAELQQRADVVAAFLAAARSGDMARLLAVLDPEVVVRTDDAAMQLGAQREERGASAVAATFIKRSRGARAALLDGVPGAVWSPGGTVRVLFQFIVAHGRITRIDLLGDAALLANVRVHQTEPN